jgi:hypothetical protein
MGGKKDTYFLVGKPKGQGDRALGCGFDSSVLGRMLCRSVVNAVMIEFHKMAGNFLTT